MRFNLAVLRLGVESLDHRWLDPLGVYELPYGQAAPVMKPVLGGTEYETVGVIELLVKEENTVYALGEVFSDLDVYKALIDGEKVLSVETFPFETAVVRGTLRIQRLTVRGALVIDKAGWAWR